MLLHTFEENERCVKIDVRQNTLLEDTRGNVTLSHIRVFSQHFGNMTRPLELGIFASFYTKLGKNTPYNKNKNIK